MPASEQPVPEPSGAEATVKRKRVVTTAADREKARLKAEDSRWRAAKTPEAKAWINPTRLLKEFLASGDDVLSLKVGAATRRDLWARSDAMGLHVEMFDTRPSRDAPIENWIALGRLTARMAIAGRVRDIQRQNKRDLQEAEDNEAEADTGANDETNRPENIDPFLREHIAPVAQMLPGIQELGNPPVNARQQYPKYSSTNQQLHRDDDAVPQSDDSLPGEVLEAAKQLDELKSRSAHQLAERQQGLRADQKLQEQAHLQQLYDLDQREPAGLPPAADDDRSDERITDWVNQQAQSVQHEKDVVDPSGKWKITCPAINEQLGTSEELAMTIYIEKTQPHSDNDTDDGNDDNMEEPDTSSTDLTEAQKSRLETYQMWATFDMGLYQGIIRFMSPTFRSNGPKARRSDFDLQPDQLPSPANRTFQYKWRGRETTDSEISVEAEQATQWIKFEEDGVGLSGVFESEYLGEAAFEGAKIGRSEAARSQLGRLWSQVSPQAHEIEARQKQ